MPDCQPTPPSSIAVASARRAGWLARTLWIALAISPLALVSTVSCGDDDDATTTGRIDRDVGDDDDDDNNVGADDSGSTGVICGIDVSPFVTCTEQGCAAFGTAALCNFDPNSVNCTADDLKKYNCIAQTFVCDAATGRATAASSTAYNACIANSGGTDTGGDTDTGGTGTDGTGTGIDTGIGTDTDTDTTGGGFTACASNLDCQLLGTGFGCDTRLTPPRCVQADPADCVIFSTICTQLQLCNLTSRRCEADATKDCTVAPTLCGARLVCDSGTKTCKPDPVTNCNATPSLCQASETCQSDGQCTSGASCTPPNPAPANDACNLDYNCDETCDCGDSRYWQCSAGKCKPKSCVCSNGTQCGSGFKCDTASTKLCVVDTTNNCPPTRPVGNPKSCSNTTLSCTEDCQCPAGFRCGTSSGVCENKTCFCPGFECNVGQTCSEVTLTCG
jgi:hypothetical protein